ncbi:hypothetical protein WCU73_02525 [Pectobacterium brasiliense]|uniref:hypothetical protein n=1 Tax=Pectobacterium brasiliense TaxID=180957 RepID=UPI003019158E
MSGAFNQNDTLILLNTFGEDLVLNGKKIKIIHEQEDVVFEDTIVQQNYFTTLRDSVKLGQYFHINSNEYVIENIQDDLSGLVNVYYRKATGKKL